MSNGIGDIGDSGRFRNLDEIQEADPAAPASRVGALVLASLGGACIVFAAVALLRAPSKAKPVRNDPLGDLVARAQPAASQRPTDALGQPITFPGVLSDGKTTALEAVRQQATLADSAGRATTPMAQAPATPPDASAGPSSPLLSPVPAQEILQPAPDGAPSDTLAVAARRASREDGTETAQAGGPGNYQLQVSSFKTPPEAEAFASALRRRGHRAYVEPAYVKGRGLWHRVRIGPFKYRHNAVIYRQEFEAKERIVTFIVDPPKTTVRIREADDSDASASSR